MWPKTASLLPSSRPCPRCGGTMYYKANWLTFLTQLRRRVCLEPTCGFSDAQLVKVVPEDS